MLKSPTEPIKFIKFMPFGKGLAILIPVLVLVVAPLLAAAIVTSTGYYGDILFSFASFYITTVDMVLIVISIAYGMFPILYNIFRSFRKHAEYAGREYRTVTKILRIEIPLLAIFTLYYFFFSPSNFEINYFYDLETLIWESEFFYFLDGIFVNSMYGMLYSVVGGLLWIAFIRINKDFYFYLAKGCFQNILEKNEVGKMESMIGGLRYYNEYLEKVLRLKINNIDQVFSKLLSDSKIDKQKVIKTIHHAFEENDRLQPINCISTALGIQETEKLLARQPVAEKIKNWTTYVIATIIPFMVSIIQLLFPSAPK
ncbi:MAG TPA: hypothetical protein VHF08_01490 [Nitrososphaeraceae archaeon]|nr:hypothetical protein [Nitrososphaeraceae archaeon]